MKDRFDLVSWDPRGTGSSRPVDCVDDAYLDFGAVTAPVPDTAETLEISHEYNAGFALGAPNGTARMRDRSARATPRAISKPSASRSASQSSTTSDISYGTVIGATYAQMFPTTIRHDGARRSPRLWLQHTRLRTRTGRGLHAGARRVPRMVRGGLLVRAPSRGRAARRLQPIARPDQRHPDAGAVHRERRDAQPARSPAASSRPR